MTRGMFSLGKNTRWFVYYTGLKTLRGRSEIAVLELGRIRSASGFVGDGHSTVFFALQNNVTRIDSVDIRTESEALTREILGPFDYKVVYYNGDSLEILQELSIVDAEPYDVILFDTINVRQHTIKEFVLAVNGGLLTRETLVLLDDVETKTKRVLEAGRVWGVVVAENERAAAIRFPDPVSVRNWMESEILR